MLSLILMANTPLQLVVQHCLSRLEGELTSKLHECPGAIGNTLLFSLPDQGHL